VLYIEDDNLVDTVTERYANIDSESILSIVYQPLARRSLLV